MEAGRDDDQKPDAGNVGAWTMGQVPKAAREGDPTVKSAEMIPKSVLRGGLAAEEKIRRGLS